MVNPEKMKRVLAFTKKGNANLEAMGFTRSFRRRIQGTGADRVRYRTALTNLPAVLLPGSYLRGADRIADKQCHRRAKFGRRIRRHLVKHDRVNYAVTDTRLKIQCGKGRFH